MAYYPRRRRVMRKRPARRYAKKRVSAKKYHGVKKFITVFKKIDVRSAPAGTNPGGWARNNLAVHIAEAPIHTQLAALYKQFMITGVAWKYVPNNVAPEQDSGENARRILFVEDKDSLNDITESQARSQDNCRMLSTAKPFKHYIKMPRPSLYQLNAAGNPIHAAQGSRFGTWLSFGELTNTLKHLNAQMLVEDNTGIVNVDQGELWCRMYIAVKEQCLN